MAESVLSRYLDPEALGRLGARRIEPGGLVMGSLAGAHKSPLHGFAVEFAGHREYVWGDDPRHIDWRVYYTRGKYVIKQYQMETNFVCHLFLDVSSSMRYGDGERQKLAYASRLVATLGYAIVRQSDKVSLATFDTRVRAFLPPSDTLAQILRMTEELDRSQPAAKTSLPDCLTELAGRIGRRELVFVFSDFFTDLEALEEALQRLRYQHHLVVLFQVLHPDELRFELDGMTKFVGLEAPEELLAAPEEIRGAYLSALGDFNGRFEDLCRRNRVERALVDTGRALSEVLLDVLKKRRP